MQQREKIKKSQKKREIFFLFYYTLNSFGDFEISGNSDDYTSSVILKYFFFGMDEGNGLIEYSAENQDRGRKKLSS
jgi:hypothetical protein